MTEISHRSNLNIVVNECVWFRFVFYLFILLFKL